MLMSKSRIFCYICYVFSFFFIVAAVAVLIVNSIGMVYKMSLNSAWMWKHYHHFQRKNVARGQNAFCVWIVYWFDLHKSATAQQQNRREEKINFLLAGCCGCFWRAYVCVCVCLVSVCALSLRTCFAFSLNRLNVGTHTLILHLSFALCIQCETCVSKTVF